MSRLRRIIKSVIKESVIEQIKKEFNIKYGTLMLNAGSDHYSVSPEYAREVDHYKMLNDLCINGTTMYGDGFSEIEKGLRSLKVVL